MATANSIILIISMLVSYIVGVLTYIRPRDKYYLFLLVIVVLSIFAGLMAITTNSY